MYFSSKTGQINIITVLVDWKQIGNIHVKQRQFEFLASDLHKQGISRPK